VATNILEMPIILYEEPFEPAVKEAAREVGRARRFLDLELSQIPTHRTIQIQDGPHRTHYVFVVSRLDHIRDDIAHRLRSPDLARKSCLFFPDQLPPESLPDRLAKAGVKSLEHTHLSQRKDLGAQLSLVQRWLTLLARNSTAQRIVDAWREDDTFVIMSPSFKRLETPLSKLPSLHGKSRKALEKFEIDEDGSFVYWPDLDVHLGWDQFLQAVDPIAALKARQESEFFNIRYGATIKALRERSRLRQADIPGLAARQLGRIEKGECRATHAALSALAEAHGMVLNDYLGELARGLRTIED
jgi:hypothetical protein